MDQTWQVIRERVPNPALPARTSAGGAAERPSWLQIAVAGLAVAVLPRAQSSGRPVVEAASVDYPTYASAVEVEPVPSEEDLAVL